MRYFQTYEQLVMAMRNKLVLERGYNCACLKIGNDFVFTYYGKEAARQTPEDIVMLTIPGVIGINWKKNFGFLYRQDLQRHVPWRGKLEAHRRIEILKREPAPMTWQQIREYRANRANYMAMRTIEQVAVQGTPEGITDVWVPDSSKPRLKLLTDEGKYQLKHRMAETLRQLIDGKALQTLRGDAPPPDTYGYWVMAPRNGRFVGIFEDGVVNRTNHYYPEFLRRFSADDMKVIISKNKWWLAERWNLPVTYEEVK